MIALLRIHTLVRTARVMVFIGMAADFVRAVACRRAGALAIEAAATHGYQGSGSAAPGKMT
jgi:hypothetical protein